MEKKSTGSISIMSWYCCNCGTQVSAIRDKEGFYKVKCPTCKCCAVRKMMGRRRDVIEIIAPKGQVHIGAVN